MNSKVLTLLQILALFSDTSCLRIFSVLSFGSHSHFSVGNAILEALHGANHEITVVTPYLRKKTMKGFREISTADTLENFKEDTLGNAFEFREKGPIEVMTFLYTMGTINVETYLSHPNVQKIMNSGETFDVCIFENFNTEAMLGMIDGFNCTLVTFTTFVAVTWTDIMTGNTSPPSYVPHPFLDYTDKMSFTQRFNNFLTFGIERFLYNFYHLPNQRKLFKKFYPNAKKSMDEILKSSAVIFMNNHVSASSPRPYLPNMIEIGGIHVKPAKPLPEDIKKFLDSATDGAVLFSMGSIIQASKWPVEKREAFVRAFGKIKQKVLWKYENDTLPNKPDNVMISPWIPQRDVLAHPNVKLFISHGGKLGTTEAFYEGVPVLGVPVFGDQMMNIAKLVSKGQSKQILYEDIDEKLVSKTLNEILKNPKYKENAKAFSQRFKDRVLTPQQEVVFWTEYVSRHSGAKFLKATGADMNTLAFYSIDVFAALLGILLVILYVKFRIFKFVASKFQKKAPVKLKKN